MSDVIHEPGWWLASDGNWYPPDQEVRVATGWRQSATGFWVRPPGEDTPAPRWWWRGEDGTWYPPTRHPLPPVDVVVGVVEYEGAVQALGRAPAATTDPLTDADTDPNGADLYRFCKSCGGVAPTDASFCGECGRPLTLPRGGTLSPGLSNSQLRESPAAEATASSATPAKKPAPTMGRHQRRSVRRIPAGRAVLVAVVVIAAVIGISIAVSSQGAAPRVGLGATVAQMSAAHGEDQGPAAVCGLPNSCFGTSVANAESGQTYQFVDATVGDGHIDGYQQNFPTHTTFQQAKATVLQWLPKDATVGPLVVDQHGGSCGLLTITSRTLGKEFAATALGDPKGVVAVDFSYSKPNLNVTYNPSNVQDATLDVGPVNPNANC